MLPARASLSSLIGTSFSLISRNTEHIQHSMSIAACPSIPALASTVPCHLVSCNTTLHHSPALRTPSPGTVMRHATTTRQLATLANIQYSQQYVWFLSVFVVILLSCGCVTPGVEQCRCWWRGVVVLKWSAAGSCDFSEFGVSFIDSHYPAAPDRWNAAGRRVRKLFNEVSVEHKNQILCYSYQGVTVRVETWRRKQFCEKWHE